MVSAAKTAMRASNRPQPNTSESGAALSVDAGESLLSRRAGKRIK